MEYKAAEAQEIFGSHYRLVAKDFLDFMVGGQMYGTVKEFLGTTPPNLEHVYDTKAEAIDASKELYAPREEGFEPTVVDLQDGVNLPGMALEAGQTLVRVVPMNHMKKGSASPEIHVETIDRVSSSDSDFGRGYDFEIQYHLKDSSGQPVEGYIINQSDELNIERRNESLGRHFVSQDDAIDWIQHIRSCDQSQYGDGYTEEIAQQYQEAILDVKRAFGTTLEFYDARLNEGVEVNEDDLSAILIDADRLGGSFIVSFAAATTHAQICLDEEGIHEFFEDMSDDAAERIKVSITPGASKKLQRSGPLELAFLDAQTARFDAFQKKASELSGKVVSTSAEQVKDFVYEAHKRSLEFRDRQRELACK